MWTPIGVLWTFLSIIVAGLCGFSFLQPFWFIQRETMNSLGLYSFCIKSGRGQIAGPVSLPQDCGIYGGYFHFSNLPSNAWQVSVILYGGGCCLLSLAAVMALLALCLPGLYDKKVSTVTGYIQITAVVIMIAGLVIYPLGLDSTFVRHYCRHARMYHAGSCQIGWSYLLGIVGTALAIFTPFLSQYTDLKLSDSGFASERDRKGSASPKPTYV